MIYNGAKAQVPVAKINIAYSPEKLGVCCFTL